MLKDTDKIPGLNAKARALTDSFFAKENARILQELKTAVALEEKKIAFREYLNIENDEILDALVDVADDLLAGAIVVTVEDRLRIRRSPVAPNRSVLAILEPTAGDTNLVPGVRSWSVRR